LNISARAIARLATSPFQPIGWIVGVMSKAHGWTVDRRREVRIRDLRIRMQVAYNVRDLASVANLGRQIFAECDARSPAQFARMERRALAAMDEHMREALGR
jgi:hypothetical protein